MPNELLNIKKVTQEAARLLLNNLRLAGYVNRDYDDQFARSGAKIGSVLNVRMPVKYALRRGQALQPQTTVETSQPVAIQYQTGVDLQFSTAELALDIDDYSKRYIAPAIATIVNDVDWQIGQQYKEIYNSVGVPGVMPSSNLTYMEAGALLDKTATPRGNGARHMVLSEDQMPAIVNANQALFNSSDKIGRQYRTGQFSGETLGWDTWAMDQNVARHTVGPLGGSPATTTAGQTGAALLTSGWTAAIGPRLNRGDVFTIAGVYGVNPVSRQTTGKLQQFVALADVASDAAGAATIPIAPAIIPAGVNQTVTAAPGAAAPLTILGAAGATGPVGLGFHEDAITLVMADLPLPDGVWMRDRQSDKNLGISVRIVKAYDVFTDSQPARLDILWGVKTLRPEMAVRVHG